MGTSSRAKAMRAVPTGGELAMWRALHQFRGEGLHFRREVPIGPYFADFACRHARVVVEVDGDTHAGHEAYDTRRTAYLEARGYRVIRFDGDAVQQNPEGVWQVLSEALAGVERRPRR